MGHVTNRLYYGDNLEVLRTHIADESIDLIYLDPPFNSNAGYNVLTKFQAALFSAAIKFAKLMLTLADLFQGAEAAADLPGEKSGTGGGAGEPSEGSAGSASVKAGDRGQGVPW